MKTWILSTEKTMPRRVRYEQDAEVKRKGNTDYIKTDARTKDGWRAVGFGRRVS